MGTADNGINGAVAEWIRRRAFPALKVGANSLLLGDGKLYTSAGITAGIDLCVALIEEDFGRPTALAVARELVIFMKRPIPRSNSSGNGVER